MKKLLFHINPLIIILGMLMVFVYIIPKFLFGGLMGGDGIIIAVNNIINKFGLLGVVLLIYSIVILIIKRGKYDGKR